MAEVRKTAKYYREILAGNDLRKSLSVIPEIINKFGFVREYSSEINFGRDVVNENFNWNHSIEGFELLKDGKLYAMVYWQGDSTDGTESVLATKLLNGSTIPAEWDDVGGSWGRVCRHSPLEVTTEELSNAIKAIIPLLSNEKIRERKKAIENGPYIMPMYGRINRYLDREHPYNMWVGDEYKEKYRNAEEAIRNLMIADAKKYMKMSESDCEAIMAKVYEENFKLKNS